MITVQTTDAMMSTVIASADATTTAKRCCPAVQAFKLHGLHITSQRHVGSKTRGSESSEAYLEQLQQQPFTCKDTPQLPGNLCLAARSRCNPHVNDAASNTAAVRKPALTLLTHSPQCCTLRLSSHCTGCHHRSNPAPSAHPGHCWSATCQYCT